MIPIRPRHILNLQDNLAEVNRLLEIHSQTAGSGSGRKHNVEVLNRSALVLLVACWEAFVEDLATNAFDFLLKEAGEPEVFPKRVLVRAASTLRNDPDESKVWELAGESWRSVLEEHRKAILKRYVGRLNTPKPEQVDALFEDLLGLKKVSSSWRWQQNPASKIRKDVTKLIERRGEIAHRVREGPAVHKRYVEDSSERIIRIACQTSNRVGVHLKDRTDSMPWPKIYRGRVV